MPNCACTLRLDRTIEPEACFDLLEGSESIAACFVNVFHSFKDLLLDRDLAEGGSHFQILPEVFAHHFECLEDVTSLSHL